jgi:glycogen synthase
MIGAQWIMDDVVPPYDVRPDKVQIIPASDQVGDAGLLFDGKQVSPIGDALQAMATDADLRRPLVERGHRRVGDFDWERTAKAYRAVYRPAADAMLTEEDRWLLSWDWMREPHKKLDAQEIL